MKEFLRDKHLLLVLDNFEQVLGAALLLSDLLATAAGLKSLVTSRALLQLRFEHAFPVPPLGLPGLERLPPREELLKYPAIDLFLQWAMAVKPDFRLNDNNASDVARICAQLDGLPLALELAAARIKLLPPSALLARLGNHMSLLTSSAPDLPPRQWTMRGAIEWSNELLDPDSRRLFRRLAVFRGGWSLEAAEAICRLEGDPPFDLLEKIETLLEQQSDTTSLQARKVRGGRGGRAAPRTVGDHPRICLGTAGGKRRV